MKQCSVDGCDGKHDAKGYCAVHYYRWKKHGDPLMVAWDRIPQDSGTCTYGACTKKPISKNLCASHYNKVKADAAKADGSFSAYGLGIAGDRACRDCGETKPLGDFPRRRGCNQGRAPMCKACYAKARSGRRRLDLAANRAKEAAHRDRTREQQRVWWRNYANRKHAENPGLYAARLRARYWADPEQARTTAKAWREANPDKFRESCRKAQSKRRTVLSGGLVVSFTEEQFRARMAYWGDRCYMCARSWKAVEHVKPISKGGAHCLANIRPACTPCNASKGGKWKGPLWAMNLIGSNFGSPWAAVA